MRTQNDLVRIWGEITKDDGFPVSSDLPYYWWRLIHARAGAVLGRGERGILHSYWLANGRSAIYILKYLGGQGGGRGRGVPANALPLFRKISTLPRQVYRGSELWMSPGPRECGSGAVRVDVDDAFS